ncbi:hypothetical protein [Streptomyces sp. NPDC085596]|uniref:hypothetical protein n=1 Tax=Streptomyces sp. NPDC085596 TaxID=3365731 RepID=UPI0037D70ADF
MTRRDLKLWVAISMLASTLVGSFAWSIARECDATILESLATGGGATAAVMTIWVGLIALFQRL